ncbi:hypothetical protein ACHAW5_000273, partial [Stephanodiscus triporus]
KYIYQHSIHINQELGGRKIRKRFAEDLFPSLNTEAACPSGSASARNGYRAPSQRRGIGAFLFVSPSCRMSSLVRNTVITLSFDAQASFF